MPNYAIKLKHIQKWEKEEQRQIDQERVNHCIHDPVVTASNHSFGAAGAGH